MKKILAVILSVMLVLSMIPISTIQVNAYTYPGDFSLVEEPPKKSGVYTYRLTTTGKAAITGYSGSASELTVPSTLDGHSVGGILGGFSGCSSLTSVTIPSSVTVISAAFRNCTNLTSVTIPSSVTYIGNDTFSGCINLTDVEIPAGVTYIGELAFYKCGNLTEITIPDSVTSIGGYAFYGCYSLTQIILPNSITKIDSYTFYGCNRLTEITIPDSVTKIETYAFYGCHGLTQITIPDSVTSIGGRAFEYCTGLTQITLPDGLTRIEYGLFSDCDNLTKITIPESVTSIEGEAFYKCGRLNYIDIPYGVKNIGDRAFSGCSTLTEIAIPESVNSFRSAFDKGTTLLCVENSYAHTYAVTNRIPYRLIFRTPAKPILESKTDTSVTLERVPGYEYSRDRITWQESNVFTDLDSHAELKFYQRIVTDGKTGTSIASPPLIVKNDGKQIVAAPGMPVLESKTGETVKLVSTPGYEYSKDGNIWQKSNVFENLTPLTKYTFYQRVAETNTNYASKTSEGLLVTTDKATNKTTPAQPDYQSKTDTSITLVAIDGYEYRRDDLDWQSSNVFNGLSPNTTYYFYQRVAETDTVKASKESYYKIVTTDRSRVSAPVAPPKLLTKDGTSVTLMAVDGYEYSKDGTTWQRSNIFTELSPVTEYTFYQRVAQTNTTYASEPSPALKVTTDKDTPPTPPAPKLEKKTDSTVTLVAVTGYEYSLDGKTWQVSNVFTGLSRGTEYAFYQRVAETNTTYASELSSALFVKTYFGSCTHCDGDGIAQESCRRCDGKGTISSWSTCSYCNGYGAYCSACGTGTTLRVTGYGTFCGRCGLPTAYDCSRCERGQVWKTSKCSSCKEGIADVACPECGGTGFLENSFAGDVNGDGEVNDKDVEYLLLHTLFPESYPIESDADFNGDGEVNNQDVEYLLLHTLFPDSYPLNIANKKEL